MGHLNNEWRQKSGNFGWCLSKSRGLPHPVCDAHHSITTSFTSPKGESRVGNSWNKVGHKSAPIPVSVSVTIMRLYVCFFKIFIGWNDTPVRQGTKSNNNCLEIHFHCIIPLENNTEFECFCFSLQIWTLDFSAGENFAAGFSWFGIC